MPSKTRIFVLDDNKPILSSLGQFLKRRGFEVVKANGVEQARAAIAAQQEDLDVAVLDMRLTLKDDFYRMTGADVGFQINEKQSKLPPEFLIYSAYDNDLEFYRRALKLRVAAYLDKRKFEVNELVPHVRVLALRRALSFGNEALMEQIQEIAGTSETAGEAVGRFCKEILGAAMTRLLGAPFVLLLTDLKAEDGRGTIPVGGSATLPGELRDVYDKLQRMTFLSGTSDQPLKLAGDELRSVGGEDQALGMLEGAVFVPLAKNPDFELSLGVLQEDLEENPLVEDAGKLVGLVHHYFRDSVVYHVLRIVERWTQLREQILRRRIMKGTADLFWNVGREQVQIIDEAKRAGEIVRSDNLEYLPRLEALGEDLRAAGEILVELSEGAGPRAEIDLAELVRQVWQITVAALEMEASDALRVEGEARVWGDNERLYAALSRVLEWFAERWEEDGTIRVVLKPERHSTSIWFEDHSRRLPYGLRQRLFDPFALGSSAAVHPGRPGSRFTLFLAKLLVESQAGGALEDRTEELVGEGQEDGHRFVLRLPVLEPATASTE